MNYRKLMKKNLHKIAKHTDWDVRKINKNHYQIWVNPKQVTLYQNYPFVKIRLYHDKPAKVRFNEISGQESGEFIHQRNALLNLF